MVGLVAGTAWAAGVNLYAVVALLGIYGRLGFGDVPEVFTRTDVIAVALVLFAVEFVVDKVPLLDSLWDLVHTAIRPLGAVGIALLLTGDAEARGSRPAVRSPPGARDGQPRREGDDPGGHQHLPGAGHQRGVSLGEDGLVAVVVWLAVTNPLVALVLVVGAAVGGTALTVALFATARRTWRTSAGPTRRVVRPQVSCGGACSAVRLPVRRRRPLTAATASSRHPSSTASANSPDRRSSVRSSTATSPTGSSRRARGRGGSARGGGSGRSRYGSRSISPSIASATCS
jgi:hypothetical protein